MTINIHALLETVLGEAIDHNGKSMPAIEALMRTLRDEAISGNSARKRDHARDALTKLIAAIGDADPEAGAIVPLSVSYYVRDVSTPKPGG